MIIGIFNNSVPLLCATVGALFSEYVGALAIFVDGAINLSAFLFFSFCIFTQNIGIAFFLTLFVMLVLIFFLAVFTFKLKANIFLVGLSYNAFASGITSLLSHIWFGTRGTLGEHIQGTSVFSSLSVAFSGLPLSIIVWILIILVFIWITISGRGLMLRASGENPRLLKSRGESIYRYKIFAWLVVGFFASLAGSIYVLRLSAYVPSISGGRGWIALVLVFLGRKKIFFVILAVLFFAVMDYAIGFMQSLLPLFNSQLVFAIPYIVTLLLFLFLPQNHKN